MWSFPCAPAALWSHEQWQSHRQRCGGGGGIKQWMNSVGEEKGDILTWGDVSARGCVSAAARSRPTSAQLGTGSGGSSRAGCQGENSVWDAAYGRGEGRHNAFIFDAMKSELSQRAAFWGTTERESTHPPTTSTRPTPPTTPRCDGCF